MDAFWSVNYSGLPFSLFNLSHIGALSFLLLAWIGIFFWKNPTETSKKRFRYALAALLVLDELILHFWWIRAGLWSVQTMLPLHLCAVLVWASALMLITKNKALYGPVFLLGVPGALQAMLTPDLGIYNFPHFRFFSVFISHGSIILAAMYMTAVEKYRPTLRTFSLSWLVLQGYALVVMGINFVVGSNYLYINRPPDTPSLIDVLVDVIGPWPYYLIGLEVLLLIFMGVAYLPFAIMDWRSKRNPASGGI